MQSIVRKIKKLWFEKKIYYYKSFYHLSISIFLFIFLSIFLYVLSIYHFNLSKSKSMKCGDLLVPKDESQNVNFCTTIILLFLFLTLPTKAYWKSLVFSKVVHKNISKVKINIKVTFCDLQRPLRSYLLK